MRIHRFVALGSAVAVAVTLAAAPAAAQKGNRLETTASGQGGVINKMTPSDVEELLRDMGYEFERLSGENTAYRFQLAGRPVVIFLSRTGMNLQLWTYLTGRKVSLDQINSWNRSKRFSRAYLDDDGDPNVEYDIDLEGGVTLGAVREGIETFEAVVTAFKDFF
jgi:hypothetical protein